MEGPLKSSSEGLLQGPSSSGPWMGFPFGRWQAPPTRHNALGRRWCAAHRVPPPPPPTAGWCGGAPGPHGPLRRPQLAPMRLVLASGPWRAQAPTNPAALTGGECVGGLVGLHRCSAPAAKPPRVSAACACACGGRGHLGTCGVQGGGVMWQPLPVWHRVWAVCAYMAGRWSRISGRGETAGVPAVRRGAVPGRE